jgi:hypothetical protein
MSTEIQTEDIDQPETPEEQPEAAEVQGDNPTDADKLADAVTRADKYARELFTAKATATGRFADPTDMPFDAALLDDADAFTAAVDALLNAKPHLASRKPVWGDVGAGQATPSTGGPTFADLFRSG